MKSTHPGGSTKRQKCAAPRRRQGLAALYADRPGCAAVDWPAGRLLQPGRRLLAGEDGLWVDLVYWDSLEKALQAAQAFQDIPSAQPMIAMLDPDSISMYHLEAVYEDTQAEDLIQQSKAE